MNIEPVVASLLAAVALLENSDDTEVNPDVAVRGMESMAHALAALGDEDALEFVGAVQRIAAAQTDPGLSELYRSVPVMLGVVT